MMMTTISVHAYQGVQSAFADAQRAGRTTVRGYSGSATRTASDVRSDRIVTPTADLARSGRARRTNFTSARQADDIPGSLLDILA